MIKSHLPTVTTILTTVFIYILTKNPLTSPFKLQLAIFSILLLVGFLVMYRKKDNERAPSSGSEQAPVFDSEQKSAGLFTTVITITILSIVAATGWFYSPFFFSLYLLAILFAFIFGLGAMLGFVTTLTILFSFNIGEVDLAYDFLVVLSLLTTIPLSIYLRKEYLKLKQVEKQILILQSEQKSFNNKVEEILANKVTNFAVNIRQPINDTKQLAYQMEKLISKEEWEKDRDRIIKASDEALTMLKDFEEGVTGRKLVSHLNIDDNKDQKKPDDEEEEEKKEKPDAEKSDLKHAKHDEEDEKKKPKKE